MSYSPYVVKREMRKARLESKFLEACGFDIQWGFFEEDVKRYRSESPALYTEMVTDELKRIYEHEEQRK